jgi:D-erythrulose 1-phosphate 3-epimerase
MTRFKLGTNLIFAGNRFVEPEEWSRVIREELDLDFVQFSADVLDPSWPKTYVDEYIKRTRQCLQKYNLQVDSMFTGNFTRRHLFLHPDAGGRKLWFDWYKNLIKMGAEIGAYSAGSHFGVMSVHDISDRDRYNQRLADGIQIWQELSEYAKEIGFRYLFFETMSVPREMAYTVEEAKDLYARLNSKSALPILLCLDVGHAPHPDQRDSNLWLRELGALACIVHLQQTDINNSRHWPFTPEYNQVGIVDPVKTLQTIEASGADEVFLHFEILHRESYENESKVINDLKESVAYWRSYLKDFDEARLNKVNPGKMDIISEVRS